jgi:hypothetical protein
MVIEWNYRTTISRELLNSLDNAPIVIYLMEKWRASAEAEGHKVINMPSVEWSDEPSVYGTEYHVVHVRGQVEAKSRRVL